MRVPIACSLTATAARSQLQDWHDLRAAFVDEMARISPTELVLRIRRDRPGLDDVVRLAQREKACCPFFDFALLIEAESVSLRVTVPDEAASILDDFGRC